MFTNRAEQIALNGSLRLSITPASTSHECMSIPQQEEFISLKCVICEEMSEFAESHERERESERVVD